MLNCVEDIHYFFCLQLLQQDAYTNECSCPPTATTAYTNTQGGMCIKHTRQYVYQTHKAVCVYSLISSLVSEVLMWNHNWNLHFVCGFISHFLSIHMLLANSILIENAPINNVLAIAL